MIRWIRSHQIETLLFLLLWGTCFYFYQSTQHNEAARFDQLRAIVNDHTLAIDRYWWNSADTIHYDRNGTEHVYPNKAPGLTLISVVPYAVVSWSLKILRLPDWVYWHLVVFLTTLFTVGLASALAAIITYRGLRSLGASCFLSLLSVVAIWLGTLVFPYSTLFFSHAMAAALLITAFWLLFRLKLATEFREQVILAAGAGLLMGASVVTEFPTAGLVTVMSVYAVHIFLRSKQLAPNRKKILTAWILAGSLGGLALLIYNVIAYGTPFYLSYEAYTKTGAWFSATYTRGWLGFQLPSPQQFWRAIAALTVQPKIGFLYIGFQKGWIYACNPVLWLCLPGLVWMIWNRERRPEGLLVASLIATYFLLISSYGTWEYDWSGASYLGSRHFVPLLPFLVLPIYFGARRIQVVFFPLFALSVFYMLIATAIEPRVSIPYDNPARDFLMPEYLRGQFAQNDSGLFHREKLTKNSTAFNPAKLAGVPGPWQLAPSMLWWLIVGGAGLLVAKHHDLRDTSPSEIDSPATWKDAWTACRIPHLCLFLFVTTIAVAPPLHQAIAPARSGHHGLTGKYFRTADWTGDLSETGVDPEIDFDWSKTYPLPPPFSVEWTGQLAIEKAGNYVFGLTADDGAILEIDHKIVADTQAGLLLQKQTGSIDLSGGLHPIRIRYFNKLFGGSIHLTWTVPGQSEQTIPAGALVPAAVAAPRR